MTDDPQTEFLFPFVVVTSKGGPYDDIAYSAGYEMGELDACLSASPTSHEVTIRADNSAQADMIAMHYGYTCVTETSEEWPEWCWATFKRGMDANGKTIPTEETGDADGR